MKKVLVSGANGFVGTELIRALSARDIKIIAIIKDHDEIVTAIEHLPNVKIIYCRLDEFAYLPELIADRDIDVFYHLAWVGSAGPLRASYDVQLDNARYTCHAVEICKDLNIPRFVFASSIMERECALLMQTAIKPGMGMVYSAGKTAAHYMAKSLAASLGLEYVSAVISNVYGVGETSPRLINSSLRKLLAGESPEFTAGEQYYDFIYCTDAAKAFYYIGAKGKPFAEYYLGSHNPRKLKEFLIEMRDQIAPGIELGLGKIPFNGVSLDYDNIDYLALNRDTGFVPEISFADGVVKTAQWLKGV